MATILSLITVLLLVFILLGLLCVLVVLFKLVEKASEETEVVLSDQEIEQIASHIDVKG